MPVVLVRHGETALNRAKITQPPQTPLDEVGLAQAHALAGRLALMRVDTVLCSDLPRARMTVAPYLARSGRPARYLPVLRERNFGEIRGIPYHALDGDLYHEAYEPPGGETASQFRARVDDAWQTVLRAHDHDDSVVLVVTHGHFCRVLAERALTFPFPHRRPEVFANTSVTIIGSQPPHSVELVGCVEHLTKRELGREP